MRRQEIADALSTVDGVTGHTGRREGPAVGDAWPMFGPMERDAQSGQFYRGWRVIVFLPQSEAEADTWIEEHVYDLIDALDQVGYVETVEAAVTGNNQYGLQITMRGE